MTTTIDKEGVTTVLDYEVEGFTPTPAMLPPKSDLIPVATSFSPAEINKRLAAHAKIINLSIRGHRKGAAEMYGYAYIAGSELLAAKATISHGNKDPEGGLLNWVKEKFPSIVERTAQRWMAFARDIEAKAPAVPQFKKTPLQLSQGKLTAKGREAILEIIPQLMDGKNMTSFMRDSRLARDPEHQTHTPPAELTAEEKVQADIDRITTLLHSAIESITLAAEMSDLDKAKAPPSEWEKVLNACLKLSPIAREFSKGKKSK